LDSVGKEKEKQFLHEKILADYNNIANEYSKWSESTLKEIKSDLSGSLEEQLKALKQIGEKAMKTSTEQIQKIEKISFCCRRS